MGSVPASGLPRQRGIALLLILFIMTVGIATVFLSAWNNSQGKQAAAKKTELALQQAREALISFAAAHASLPGRLPCPEDASLIGGPNEGNESGSCANSQLVAGRLPWRTLGLDAPIGDEALWYVRSAGFQSRPINSDSVGQLQLDGIANAAVALVIAPGPPLPGQNRTIPAASSPPNPAQYLELGNVVGPAYQSTGPTGTFNDRVLAISAADLFRAVGRRVAGEARVALEAYYAVNGYYPNPARFDDASCLGTGNISSGCTNDSTTCNGTVCRGRIPANLLLPAAPWGGSLLRGPIGGANDWFQKNGWREMIYYAGAPACAEGTTGCSGSAFLQVQNPPPAAVAGVRALAIAAGPALAGQSHGTTAAKGILANYLEDANATSSGNVFIDAPATANTPFNDLARWLP